MSRLRHRSMPGILEFWWTGSFCSISAKSHTSIIGRVTSSSRTCMLTTRSSWKLMHILDDAHTGHPPIGRTYRSRMHVWNRWVSKSTTVLRRSRPAPRQHRATLPRTAASWVTYHPERRGCAALRGFSWRTSRQVTVGKQIATVPPRTIANAATQISPSNTCSSFSRTEIEATRAFMILSSCLPGPTAGPFHELVGAGRPFSTWRYMAVAKKSDALKKMRPMSRIASGLRLGSEGGPIPAPPA